MKKKNNKGFSLIELIIAIAILVILTGLLAPQFMRYMERARESKDMQSLDTVYGAVQTALANEEAYQAVVESAATNDLAALTGVGMTLTALENVGTTNLFVAEVVATMGEINAERLWTSAAVLGATSATDANDNVWVRVDRDSLHVTVWIGTTVAADASVTDTNALNPTTQLLGVTTAGATFLISK